MLSPAGQPVRAADEASPFEIEELFFSTTDKEGRIRTANEIFIRVSGFAAEELKNKPHNIIRHPDMPRVVFQLLWDEIKAGGRILAYVKNRAKDGRYYWVVALVTPIEGGYLSVRFKPSSRLFPEVQKLYRELRQIEAGVEAGRQGKAAAIAASLKTLDENLRQLGFDNYRAFMWHAFEREIRSRAAALKKRTTSHRRRGQSSVRSGADEGAGRVADACQTALTALDRLFDELEVYSQINDGIRSKSEFVTSLSESIRRLSLNGTVEVERLGPEGSGLGKVLEWLQWFSRDITQGCGDLTRSLLQLIAEIRSVVFELSSAKLQIEMTTDFAREMLAGTAAASGITAGAMQDLYVSSRETVEHALAALAAVETNLGAVEKSQQHLWTSIRSLRLIYFQGKIELANVVNERLEIVFGEVGLRLSDTEQNLGALETLIEQLQAELHKGVEQRGPIERAVAEIDPGPRRAAALADKGNFALLALAEA